MTEFNSVEEVQKEIIDRLDSRNKQKAVSLFAFNGSGKTSISKLFEELNENEENKRESLVYNAYFEDYFMWDNERSILKLENNLTYGNILVNNFDKSRSQDFDYLAEEIKRSKFTWVGEFFSQEDNFKEVRDYFNYLTNSNINIKEIEEFDENKKRNIITSFEFNIFLDESDEEPTPIKISRGEESLFIWSIYYTILKTTIQKFLDGEQEDSEFTKYLKYIIIDDPVSSLDENNLISIVMDLTNLIKNYQEKSDSLTLNFLISTHHPLFFNMIMKSKIIYNKNGKNNNLILKNKKSKLELEGSSKNTFTYHLFLMDELQELFNSEDKIIRKYHFNMFRSILEKTSNYLGLDNLEDCISIDNKDIIKRYIHNYSHNSISDTEFSEVNEESKQLFEEAFTQFVKDYKFNLP